MKPKKRWWRNEYALIALSLLILIFVLYQYCSKQEIDATINCPNMNKYESAEGIYNANNFSIGTVLLLDQENLAMYKIWDLTIPESSLSNHDTIEFVLQDVKVDFNIDIKGSLNEEKKAEIKAELSSEAKQTFKFGLYNHFRREAKNASIVAQNDSSLLVLINKMTQYYSDTSALICLVSGLVYADSLRIQISDMNKLKSELNTEIGEIKVNYKYSCAGDLFAGGDSSPLFWKAILMNYSASTNSLILYRGPIIDMRDFPGDMTIAPRTLSISQFNFEKNHPYLK